MSATITAVSEQRLLDETGIRRLLFRLARSIDRADVEAIAACFEEAATVDDAQLGFCGVGRDFAAWVHKRCGTVTAMATHLTNINVEIYGDRAAAESYAITIELDVDGILRWRSGRYLDLIVRADSAWAVAGRQYILDVHLPVPADPLPLSPIGSYLEGTRTAADPSVGLFRAVAGGSSWPANEWGPA
jgi:hypothetical protein